MHTVHRNGKRRLKTEENFQKIELKILPKMAQEIQKLRKDISNLMEESKRIQNSNNIPECLKIIQLRLISKMISRARAKIDYLMDRKNCSPKFRAKK